ncbi:MAG: GTPase HflX [Nitrospina sp.]|jgi:GTPase|nr:GTPase HflX [Nitrospina sp.]MBT3509426.1 GTPase HflX [Nitrospina sp.]MBT3877023.1 GTPase HflX [Nitrospina sp.]MBT4048782.1 GTPase HflX [Nitrospina sp.]MBT4556165.1 GTPase HflX [Nitrospina sp.]
MKTKAPNHTNTRPSNPKAILVGVSMPGIHSPSKISLEELEGLATTARYKPVATLTQHLTEINPKTFLGSGKVEEVKQAVRHHNPEAVIFDEELSPRQNRELENIFKCRVMDRPWVILEIFSNHAQTREAKTQVELARLKYELPRLTRMWGHLSRQRGGIGMKDVGETQIQLDRRMIRNQIHKLEKKLVQIDKEKKTQRKNRSGTYKVALVGYTNAGKSTLMNCLTGADTLVEDKLFATLDSTVRKIKKNFPYPVLLSDTVGLIAKLPHDLVASFKSTLDEVRNADLLIHVVDLSHPEYAEQMRTADDLLREMGMDDLDILTVFNKVDALPDIEVLEQALHAFPSSISISCHSGQGMESLREKIVYHYEKKLSPCRLELEHSQAILIQEIRKFALVLKEDYNSNGIVLSLRLSPEAKAKLKSILKQPVMQR